MTSSVTHSIVLALFFASGFAALLYQVVWQRLLTLVTGLDLLSVTTIVGAFMLGMGIGNLVGGRWADRLQFRSLLTAFAVAELVIGACALVSAPLYHDFFYREVAPVTSAPLVLLLAAASLLLPTFCMGLTLPLLAKALTTRLELAPARIGGLYGWNTLGAALGAGIGAAVLIRRLGYGDSLLVGAAVNAVAAAVALLLRARLVGAGPPSPVAATPAAGVATANPAGLGLRGWTALYFLSGFVALGLELTWFRLLGVILKPTAFTFPLLLTLFLAGVGLGSLAGRRLAPRSAAPFQRFLACQAAIPLYAALSVAMFAWAAADGPGPALARLREYLGSYEPIAFRFDFLALKPGQLALYLGVPAALILPPTFLMGLSFPYLQRCVQSDLGTLGSRVGRLQTANIAGSVAGVVAVGTVLLEFAGTAGTLRLLAAVSAVFLWLLVQRSALHGARVGAIVVVAAAVAVVPGQQGLWAALHGTQPDRAIVGEGASGLSVLTNAAADFSGPTTVFVSGVGQSWVPYGGGHTLLGLVPALLHPVPRDVLVIGLGSGDTLFAAAGRPETHRATGVEIIAQQLPTLRQLYARTGYAALATLLGDPRFRHVSGDGRGYLLREPARYDVIEADALRPGSAYAGNLYSREYFELVRSRLNPGGLAVTWTPTPRTQATFRAVFAHVAAVDWILVGSKEPIAFDRQAIRARSSACVHALVLPGGHRPCGRCGLPSAGIPTSAAGTGCACLRRDQYRPVPTRRARCDT
jgi:predicted membrane-bound spermidine synthase